MANRKSASSNLFNKEKSIYGSKINLTLDCSVWVFSFAMTTTLHCEKERKSQKKNSLDEL